ncbi:hypothetical protein ACF0H5_024335 [Mactra antiquata]
MAKKGGRDILTRSQLNAGDEYFELTCTRCSKKNKNKQSVKYCATCKQYFCKDCLEIHDDFHSSAGHVLVDTDSRILSSRNSGRHIKIVPTELCKEHPMEVVNMYCKDDDNVGCHVCFALHHRSCTGVEYIPRYVQEHDPTPIIDRINRKLTTSLKNIGALKTANDERERDLEKSKADCEREINQYRREINDVIDKIEKQTLAELETEYSNRKQYNTDQNLKIQKMKSDMKRFQDGIVSEQVNLAQKFVLAMIGRKLVEQSETMKSRSTEEQTSTFKFSRDTNILNFLLNIFTLGMLSSPGNQNTMETASRSKQTKQPTSITTTTASKTTTSTTTTSGATGSNIGTGTVRVVKQQSKKQGLYKVVNQSRYNMVQSDDSYTCNILSSCVTNNGDIVLLDTNNYKIKLVDSKTYNIISSLLCDALPWSVCNISSTEVVVCLLNKTIQFVSTCNNLVVTRSLSMKHKCRCITVSRDRMYICDDTSLYIYKMNGTLINTIKENKSGDKIFSHIRDITISDDHNMIHIVDYDKSVITLDMNGKICWEFSGEVLDGAYGVCTDGSGNVIVCGYMSHNVIMLGHNGDYKGEIVTQQDGVSDPHTVCFDVTQNKLYVGCEFDDNITVFTLE